MDLVGVTIVNPVDTVEGAEAMGEVATEEVVVGDTITAVLRGMAPATGGTK